MAPHDRRIDTLPQQDTSTAQTKLGSIMRGDHSIFENSVQVPSSSMVSKFVCGNDAWSARTRFDGSALPDYLVEIDTYTLLERGVSGLRVLLRSAYCALRHDSTTTGPW